MAADVEELLGTEAVYLGSILCWTSDMFEIVQILDIVMHMVWFIR